MAVIAIRASTHWPEGYDNKYGFDAIQTHLREAGRMFDEYQWLSKPAYTVYLERDVAGQAPHVQHIQYRKDLALAVRCAGEAWERTWPP